MTNTIDKVSSATIRLLDALILRNPERTAIGGTLGFAIHGLLGIIRPALTAKGVILGEVEWWASLCIGVAFVHIPFILAAIRRKPLINDELEGLIKLIESTNIGELEKRMAYRKVVNKCIDEFSLNARNGSLKEILENEIAQVSDEKKQEA